MPVCAQTKQKLDYTNGKELALREALRSVMTLVESSVTHTLLECLSIVWEDGHSHLGSRL